MSALEMMIGTPSHVPAPLPALSGIDTNEVCNSLEQMLNSAIFKRASRMCRLMRYLVEQSLHGSRRDVSEYAIGLEVFDRNPSTYYPGEDPVVRVQMGRLRDRLREYYANAGVQSAIHFSIPLGNYRLLIQRKNKEMEGAQMNVLISVIPLQYDATDVPGQSFARGVNEELYYRLYQIFGSQMISHTSLNHLVHSNLPTELPGTDATPAYLMEGSVRIDAETVKIGVRLIEAGSNAIIWSQQFAEPAHLNLALQEKMAQRIGEATRQYMQLARAQQV
jgi:TolB-like protein